MQGLDYKVINHAAVTPEVDTDIDKRCRTVLDEIDMSFECTAPYMKSAVMHSVPQMFPIDVSLLLSNSIFSFFDSRPLTLIFLLFSISCLLFFCVIN